MKITDLSVPPRRSRYIIEKYVSLVAKPEPVLEYQDNEDIH